MSGAVVDIGLHSRLLFASLITLPSIAACSWTYKFRHRHYGRLPILSWSETQPDQRLHHGKNSNNHPMGSKLNILPNEEKPAKDRRCSR